RSHKLLRRLRLAAIVLLVVLTAFSTTFGILAEINRRTADRQREIAVQRALALTAQAAAAGTPSLANAQRAAAHILAVNPDARNQETWGAALAAVEVLPTAVIRDDSGVSSGAFRPRTQDFAIAAGRSVFGHDRLGRRVWQATIT